jgi:hypothetical protein
VRPPASSTARRAKRRLFHPRFNEEILMTTKRKIEIFSAGCPACEETIQLINSIACPPAKSACSTCMTRGSPRAP